MSNPILSHHTPRCFKTLPPKFICWLKNHQYYNSCWFHGFARWINRDNSQAWTKPIFEILIEGNLIWTNEQQRWEESEKRREEKKKEDQRRESQKTVRRQSEESQKKARRKSEESQKKVRRKSEESQKKEGAGARKGSKVAKHYVIPMICGSGGWKVGSLKWRVRSHASDERWKIAPGCGPKNMSKSKRTKLTMFGPILEVEMSQKCTPLWREAHLELKM